MKQTKQNVLQLLFPKETYKRLLVDHKKDPYSKRINWIGKEFQEVAETASEATARPPVRHTNREARS